MECFCCGMDREPVVGLRCHNEVRVCRDCIGWLRSQAGVLDVTPILPVTDVAEAVAFYEKAGFTTRQYGDGGGYTFVHYDDQSVFYLDLATEPNRGTGAYGCAVHAPV